MSGRRARSILVIEDDSTLNRLIVDQLKRIGYDAQGVATMAEAQSAIRAQEPDLALMDFRLPDSNDTAFISWLRERCPVVVLSAYGSINQAVEAVQAGATDYLVKPVSQSRLELAVRRALETDTMRRKLAFLETQAKRKPDHRMVGQSKAFRRVAEMIRLVAEADTTVLIEGESGVGKELVAGSIHDQSPRSKNQLVTIDCCTLQETLLESELFGHERGAFTGAERKKEGLIEVAEGGTVFLDEIGETSAAIQAKLLRVLETGRFRRLGGVRDLTADVRFIAATNRSLADQVRAGQFRSDLYYRLSAFVVTVPPLRERREDILPIANHFLNSRPFMRSLKKTFDAKTEQALLSYSWPGNIRELRNAVERGLLISADGPVILPQHLSLPTSHPDERHRFTLTFDHDPSLEEVKSTYIDRILETCGGNKAKASRVMGISERNIYRLVGKSQWATDVMAQDDTREPQPAKA